MSDFQRQTDGEFTWSAHPAAERPAHAAAAVGVVLAMAGVVWLTFDSLAWAAVAVVVLVAALNRFFFPSRFTITAEGIRANYPLMRKSAKWQRLRRFVCDRYGGFLSTRAHRSRLDAYRGMHLLFGDQREEAIRLIKTSMARHDAEVQPRGSRSSKVAVHAHGEAAA